MQYFCYIFALTYFHISALSFRHSFAPPARIQSGRQPAFYLPTVLLYEKEQKKRGGHALENFSTPRRYNDNRPWCVRNQNERTHEKPANNRVSGFVTGMRNSGLIKWPPSSLGRTMLPQPVAAVDVALLG